MITIKRYYNNRQNLLATPYLDLQLLCLASFIHSSLSRSLYGSHSVYYGFRLFANLFPSMYCRSVLRNRHYRYLYCLCLFVS